MRNWKHGPRNGGWTAIAIVISSLGLIGLGLFLHFSPERFAPEAPLAQADRGTPFADPQDVLSARFAVCSGAGRKDCVVDGDTFWFRGEKIRVLDINTPETSTPRCDRELALGKAATRRFVDLLNAGPFSLERGNEETDRYGRKLRRITRGGRSLGDILIEEGLAEPWQGYRRNWC